MFRGFFERQRKLLTAAKQFKLAGVLFFRHSDERSGRVLMLASEVGQRLSRVEASFAFGVGEAAGRSIAEARHRQR